MGRVGLARHLAAGDLRCPNHLQGITGRHGLVTDLYLEFPAVTPGRDLAGFRRHTFRSLQKRQLHGSGKPSRTNDIDRQLQSPSLQYTDTIGT